MSDRPTAFTDGGVISHNPSVIGGMWAYIHFLSGEVEISRDVGVVTPEQIAMEVVTNNYTELFAAYQLLRVLPDGWDGIIHTDSLITKRRLVSASAAFNGIPRAFRESFVVQCKRMGRYEVRLLDGHPTRAHLAAGIGKRGGPVSKWNALCDEMCRKAGREFLASIKGAQE